MFPVPVCSVFHGENRDLVVPIHSICSSSVTLREKAHTYPPDSQRQAGKESKLGPSDVSIVDSRGPHGPDLNFQTLALALQ